MKTLQILVCSVVGLTLLGLTGCGKQHESGADPKPTVSAAEGKSGIVGVYADVKNPEQTLRLLSDGTWIMAGIDTGGKYSIEGNTIVLLSSDMSMQGEIKGDTIVITDTDKTVITYKKK
jgi:hypothetical protein